MDIFFNTKTLLLAGALLAGMVPLVIAQNPDKASVKPEVLEKLRQHGVEKILFVTRATNGADHYYTEYLLGSWAPNNRICSLDLKTGTIQELVPELKGGMFERFDVSFDAKRVVFAYRAAERIGYRIYEINVDGTGLRQLSFPPPDEDERIKKCGSDRCTDDMQPCYLPDGGIMFISTRCQYGIRCNPPDIFTTTVLYRDAQQRQGQTGRSQKIGACRQTRRGPQGPQAGTCGIAEDYQLGRHQWPILRHLLGPQKLEIQGPSAVPYLSDI